MHASKLLPWESTAPLLDLFMGSSYQLERYVTPCSCYIIFPKFLRKLEEHNSSVLLLIGFMILQVTTKPIVVYPNSGETYDGERKQWVVSFPCFFFFIQICDPMLVSNQINVMSQKSSGIDDGDFVSYVGKWREAGASLFGGCCRTSPHTISAIAMALSNNLQ